MKDRIFKAERIVGKTCPTLFWTLNYFTPQFLKKYEVKIGKEKHPIKNEPAESCCLELRLY